MKKILLLSLSIISCIFCLSFGLQNKKNLKKILSDEEIAFMNANNITYENIEEFLNYKNFNIYKYYDYIEIKNKYDNLLEVINIINEPDYYKSYMNTKEAINQNNYHILVNKHYYVNSDYKPNDLCFIKDFNVDYIIRENENMLLKKDALLNYCKLYNDIKSEGFNLTIYSAYRTYEKQNYLYYIVNNKNDKYSARPGYSEHQTGLTIDISTRKVGLIYDFKYTNEYKWLQGNAYKYGFIERYPENKENITLYSYEPWHYRYVGVETATYIYNNNLTLEEFIIKNYEL